jgi:hypothetical protein
MGPAILITIGVLFLVQQFHWEYGFRKTFPIILLVIGVVKLAEALASDTGHGMQNMAPGPGMGQQQGSQQSSQQGQGPGQAPPPRLG